MKREPVKSSNLASVGYDSSDSLLEIEFRDGRIYQFFKIPLNIYKSLMKADSKGSYFYQNIRMGRYTYKKIK